MDPSSAPIDDFERWFYGGSPPAGDQEANPAMRAEAVISDCRCTRTAEALIGRLRASISRPALAG